MNQHDLGASSRRSSLLSFIAAGLVAFAPRFSSAKKHRKGRSKKGDPNKLCKRQTGEWAELIAGACEDPAQCRDELACGTPLRSCDFDEFLACFFGGQGMMRAVERGTADLAALVSSIDAEAKGKKRAGTTKAKQRCRRQGGQCTTFLIPGCEDDPECLANVERCCAFAGNCDVGGFVACALGG